MPRSVTGVAIVGCDMDVRTGGTYRLEFAAEGSGTMAFYGKYLEVVPNERIVWTNDEGEQGSVTTVTFEEQDGRTRVTLLVQCASKLSRDAIIESGMEDGLQDALDLLEETAQSIR